MNDKLNSPVLASHAASVLFPLPSSTNRWRLLFGKGIDDWHQALSNVSISVQRGEIAGVIGRNGAGKSTLLRTLAGVYMLSSGSVVRLGPVSALFELGGTGGVLITGVKYVKRWLRFNGVPTRDWATLIEEIREFSELGDRLDDRIYTYSSGMAARLYFATATSIDHEIYLIDEVLSVGDEHFQAKCWKRVRERLSDGVSGVLATHDWTAILRLCLQTTELKDGQVVAEGDSERIICEYLKIADQLDPNPRARFSSECPAAVQAFSGEDWQCDIPIDATANGPVFFSYSVEKLIPGQDWHNIFMSVDTWISSSPGSHLARINVPALPLPGGEYRLNLFLTGGRPADGGPKTSFDIRSWTSGNSLKFSVDGEKERGLVKLELMVECL